MIEQDISIIAESFKEIGWDKPVSKYQNYLSEQSLGKRQIFVAFENKEFAGYLTVVSESNYQHFRKERIPEIQDFNVLPSFRRKGIGTKLMEKAEDFVAKTSKIIGIGVGLDVDYGVAQRLYVLRGYVPDAKGLVYKNQFPKYGEKVTVDDDLNLYFTKNLK